MSEYKSIKGKTVQFLGTDPSETSTEGQVWYNSTAGAFKSVVVSEAWSAGGPLTYGRIFGGGAGDKNSGLVAGGYAPAIPSSAVTEEYNGSGWSNGGNLGTARYENGLAGTQTAALSFGGNPGSLGLTELYDGTSWSEQNDLNTGRNTMGGAGTSTATLAFGGAAAGSPTANSEEFNGTSWTEGNNLNTGRRYLGGFGTQTAAVAAGGGYPTALTSVEEYDGTSWTTVTSLSATRQRHAAGGIQTSGMVFGGISPNPAGSYLNTTEGYDGTNWSTLPSLAVAKANLGGGSQTSQGTVFSTGGRPDYVTNTEEYNKSVNVITAGAWASGGNMNTGRSTGGDCGTYLAGLVFGGNPGVAPYASNATEEYGGTSWTAGGNTPHATSDLSGAGTQTAALCFGFSGSPTATTATYDGSSWTTVPGTLPTVQGGARGIGTQTAAIIVGYGPPGTGSFEYDGSTWTAGGTTNNNRTAQKPGGWGIQTAAVIASGYSSPPATIISNTETYDGTTWTETGHSVITAVKRTAVTTAGTSSDGMLNGGGDNAGTNDKTNFTQGYNGTSWFTQPSLATARLNQMGFGTSANAAVAGGDAPGGVTTGTEEFTGETSAINIKTLTTS
jgi:hypothetical protein